MTDNNCCLKIPWNVLWRKFLKSITEKRYGTQDNQRILISTVYTMYTFWQKRPKFPWNALKARKENLELVPYFFHILSDNQLTPFWYMVTGYFHFENNIITHVMYTWAVKHFLYFKRTVSADYISLVVVWLIRSWLGHEMLDFQY
jgi:hypothetical protein